MYGLGDDIRSGYEVERALRDKLDAVLQEKETIEKAYQELLEKYIKLLENRVGTI